MLNEIDSLHLQEFLSTAVIRKFRTGHSIALHFAPILRQRQMNNSMKSGVKEKAGTSFVHRGSRSQGQRQEFLKIYKLGGRPELQQLSQRLKM
jgi:hypothetical protein